MRLQCLHTPVPSIPPIIQSDHKSKPNKDSGVPYTYHHCVIDYCLRKLDNNAEFVQWNRLKLVPMTRVIEQLLYSLIPA